MNPTRFISNVSALLVVTAGCSWGPSQLSEARATAIRDSVRAMLDSYREHFVAREWDEVVRFYASDPGFQWIEDGVVRYRSAEDIRQALAALPAGMTIETTYTDTQIAPLAPEVAVVASRFETRFTDSTGASFGFEGFMTLTLVHREDGWRFLAGHTSSARPRDP